MSDKLTNSITLKSGTAQAFGKITVDVDGYGIISGNAKLRLSSSGPKKLDLWLNRVTAADATCYQSHTFPGGEDDFYLWPTWQGAIENGESYEWLVRLESGLSGSLSTRYCKGRQV
jgi:hypothetical protein